MRCDPRAPFDDGRLVEELSRPGSEFNDNDEYARLSSDELTVYFSAARSGQYDIYVAERSDPGELFGPPRELLPVNTTFTERSPSVTANGLSLFATQQLPPPGKPDGSPQYQIVHATRLNVQSPFGPFEVLANVNDLGAADIDPYVLSDGRAVYFGSTRVGGAGDADLYRSESSGGEFGTPIPVAGMGLNTSAAEDSPVVTDDELTIYFASNHEGDLDIYEATRADLSEPFGPPEQILSTRGNRDWPSWISSDGCLLYFGRSQGNGENGYDIYVATRARS